MQTFTTTVVAVAVVLATAAHGAPTSVGPYPQPCSWHVPAADLANTKNWARYCGASFDPDADPKAYVCHGAHAATYYKPWNSLYFNAACEGGGGGFAASSVCWGHAHGGQEHQGWAMCACADPIKDKCECRGVFGHQNCAWEGFPGGVPASVFYQIGQ